MKNKSLFWLYILSASVYFTQGIESLPSISLLAYLKEFLHFSPSKIMYLSSIIGIAWLIKPIQGFLCDNYLTKRTWILLSLLGSMFISLYLGISSFLPLGLLICLMVIASFNATIRDVSNDGMMCVEGKENDNCGKIQTCQWISITIAGIITALGGGWIADHFNYRIAFLCLIPIYLIILGIISRYKPQKIDKIRPCEDYYQGHCANCDYVDKKHDMLCIFPKVIKNNNLWKQIKSYKELFTNKTFLLGCLFIFCYNYNPSFGLPLMFIIRDQFKWSWTFQGMIGAIASVMSILGAILYWKFSKKINIKKVLYYSVFLGAITTLSYLYYNKYTAIIYSLVYSFVGMFIFLNIMTFMAKSTIQGKEATSFACLCTINNIASTCSTLTGAWLLPLVGLKFLIIISAVTSFICLPIIKRLKI